MPFASMPAAEPMTRHDKRRVAIFGVAVLLILAAVALSAGLVDRPVWGLRSGTKPKVAGLAARCAKHVPDLSKNQAHVSYDKSR